MTYLTDDSFRIRSRIVLIPAGLRSLRATTWLVCAYICSRACGKCCSAWGATIRSFRASVLYAMGIAIWLNRLQSSRAVAMY